MRFPSFSRRTLSHVSACLLGGIISLSAAQAISWSTPQDPILLEDMSPTKEFVGQYSDSRSPLLKKDGSKVSSVADWEKRRLEIESQWHDIMGPWPAKIANPRFEILETTEREGVIQHKVRVEVAPGQFPVGYLLRPKKEGKLPAVFVPFYEPETSVGLAGKPLRDFAMQIAKRGYIALALGTPEGDAFKPILPEEVTCQPLSYYAYLSGNVYRALANLESVDPKRVGIMGHSYGGKWAMFGAAFNSEFACGVWSDPGVQFDDTRTSVNYWEPWYLGRDKNDVRKKRGLITEENPSTGAYRILRERGHSLAEVQSLMAPRPFFVSGGSEDFAARWKELNHVRDVYHLYGANPPFGMSLRPGHSPNEESNAKILAFLDWVFSGKLHK